MRPFCVFFGESCPTWFVGPIPMPAYPPGVLQSAWTVACLSVLQSVILRWPPGLYTERRWWAAVLGRHTPFCPVVAHSCVSSMA